MEIRTYEPQEKQRVFHNAPHRYRLFGGAMGGGKSRTICEESNRQMIDYPGNRGLILRATLADFKLSTYLVLREQTLKDFISAGLVTENKADHFFTYHLGKAQSRLYYGGLDMTSKEKEKYFSAEYGCIAIDEAREIQEDDFKKLGTRLRHRLPNSKRPPYCMLLASNPSQNWLKTVFILTSRRDYIFVPALPRENKYNPPDYEQQIKDLFHGDEQFIQAYLEGSWDAVGSIDDLILMDDIKPCINARLDEPLNEERRITAVDPAREGDDMTAIYDFCNAKTVDSEIYGKKDTLENCGRISRHWVKNASKLLVIDKGYNPGLYDILWGDYGYNSLGIDFAGASSEEGFGNLRAEMYWNAREMIKNRQCSIPNDNQLHGQLCSIKYKFKGGRTGTRIYIEPKEDIKKRLGCSPDKADAFVIGLYGLRHCPVDKPKPTWRTKYKEEVKVGGWMSA
jgi:phage terminase large subunit